MLFKKRISIKLNIVVPRGKDIEREGKHGEIVKYGKIKKSTLPFAQKSIMKIWKSKLKWHLSVDTPSYIIQIRSSYNRDTKELSMDNVVIIVPVKFLSWFHVECS